MRKKRNSKKGLAMSTIIGLIILLMGFIILVFAFTQINWVGDVNTQACHQSVIYRATLPNFVGMKDYVPLKCKTDKICITTGMIGGKCSEFANEKGVRKIKVRDLEDAEQAVAQEIVNCWEMMGEGKVGLFNDWFVNSFGFGTVTSSCVICSRVAFDVASLEKSKINLSNMNVQNYMITHRMPNKDVSYFVFLTGKDGLMSINDGGNGLVKVDNLVPNGDSYNVKTEDVGVEPTSSGNASKELSVMFMQVKSPKYSEVLKNNLYAITGTGLGSYAVAPKYAGKAISAAAKSPWFWVVMAVVGVYQYGSVVSNQAVTAGYCGDVSVGSDASSGCSVVRTVNYGAEDLSKFCSRVESIP